MSGGNFSVSKREFPVALYLSSRTISRSIPCENSVARSHSGQNVPGYIVIQPRKIEASCLIQCKQIGCKH